MIYFLEAVGIPVIKVGYSAFPANRLKNCSTWSPVPLRLAAIDERGDQLTESELLRRLAPYQSHGEWFHATASIRGIVRETKKTGEVPGGWYLPAGYDKRRWLSEMVRGPRVEDITRQYGITRPQLREIFGIKTPVFETLGIPLRYVVPLLEYIQARDSTVTLEMLLSISHATSAEAA